MLLINWVLCKHCLWSRMLALLISSMRFASSSFSSYGHGDFGQKALQIWYSANKCRGTTHSLIYGLIGMDDQYLLCSWQTVKWLLVRWLVWIIQAIIEALSNCLLHQGSPFLGLFCSIISFSFSYYFVMGACIEEVVLFLELYNFDSKSVWGCSN